MASSPLRLLFSAPGFPLISETFVTDQIIGLHELGHHIDVFTTCPGRIDDPGLRRTLTAAIGTVFMPPGTQSPAELTWLSQTRRPSLRTPRTWSDLWRILNHPGFRRLRYPLKRGAALLGTGPYDAIVCHFGPAGAMLQQMRDIGLLTAPLITVFHGYDITNYLEQVPAGVYERLFARGDLFLPISERWHNRLHELGCPPQRTQLQRLGTDLGTFAHEIRRTAPGETLRLLSVARLVEKKGMEFGLRAVARLIQDGCDVQYNIVGDGPLRGKLTELVTTLDLTANVTFLGSQPHAAVADLMPQHHILLVPSVTDSEGGMEGIPVVIMEAMATGLLVVASNHSGIPEIVRHEETGLLVAERDDAGLAQAIATIREDSGRWEALVLAARDTVRQQYDLQRQNKALVTRIRELSLTAYKS